MAPHQPHLFVDISAHGFGHLAQTAPVLNRLAELLPAVKITLRSGLPIEKLRQRIRAPFTHITAASDFGYVMIDALNIDRSATAARYREAHADFAGRVTTEALLLRKRHESECRVCTGPNEPWRGVLRRRAAIHLT